MRTTAFYKILILVLLVLNLGTLSYLFLEHRHSNHPPKGRWNGIDHIIIDRLHLDDAQQNQFEQLKNEHHAHMLDLQHEAGMLHQKLFLLLQSNILDTSAKAALMMEISENDRRKEQITFEHFQQLRAILRPDQKQDFDNFVDELGGALLSRPPRPGEHP